MKNWKTTVTGITVIVLTTAGPVLDHYCPLVGMSWTATMLTISGLVSGAGLLAAKDATTSSTLAQVEAQQAKVDGHPNADALVKQANNQAAGK